MRLVSLRRLLVGHRRLLVARRRLLVAGLRMRMKSRQRRLVVRLRLMEHWSVLLYRLDMTSRANVTNQSGYHQPPPGYQQPPVAYHSRRSHTSRIRIRRRIFSGAAVFSRPSPARRHSWRKIQLTIQHSSRVTNITD